MSRFTKELLELVPGAGVEYQPSQVTDTSFSVQGAVGTGIGAVVVDDTRFVVDSSLFNQFRIYISWPVQNTGSLAGFVGGRVLIQEFAFLPVPQEHRLIEGQWSGSPLAPLLTVDDSRLSTPRSPGSPRYEVTWSPTARQIQPGELATVAFSLVVGTGLLAGKSDLDIIVALHRLDNNGQFMEERLQNAFNVSSGPVGAFSPSAAGNPVVEVNPF